jgi:hypothetical protein
MVRAWLDSRAGSGHVADTMHDTGYNVLQRS